MFHVYGKSCKKWFSLWDSFICCRDWCRVLFQGLHVSKLKSFSITGVEKGHVLWVYDPTSNDSQDKDKLIKKGKVSMYCASKGLIWRPFWGQAKKFTKSLLYFTVACFRHVIKDNCVIFISQLRFITSELRGKNLAIARKKIRIAIFTFISRNSYFISGLRDEKVAINFYFVFQGGNKLP